MNSTLLSQGLELMLFGMGTVLLFLTLLVLATRLMSCLVDRYFAEQKPPGEVAVAVDTGLPEPLLVAIVSAAIHQHRAQSRENAP